MNENSKNSLQDDDLTMVNPTNTSNMRFGSTFSQKAFMQHFKQAKADTFPTKRIQVRSYKKKNGTTVAAHKRCVSGQKVQTSKKMAKKCVLPPYFQAPDDCPASLKLVKEIRFQQCLEYLEESKERNNKKK